MKKERGEERKRGAGKERRGDRGEQKVRKERYIAGFSCLTLLLKMGIDSLFK